MSTIETFTYIFLFACLLSYLFPLIEKNNGENFMSLIDLKKIKKSYGTDTSLEIEGVWVKSALIDGLEFKMAKSGNPAYEKLARKLYKPYSKQLRRGMEISDAVTQDISNQLIVETLLMDWKGMPSSVAGEFVPFSKAEAKVLLEDKELKEFKSELLEFADDNQKFSLAEEEFIEQD